MRSFFLVTFLALFSMTVHSQTSDLLSIEQTIIAFAKAGDANDTQELDKHLDPNYRIVMNRLFGSTGVSVLPKSTFLEKIESKEFGGDDRTVNIENIIINGTTATAKVTMKGTKMTFVSLLTLVKDEKEIWRLVTDVPMIL